MIFRWRTRGSKIGVLLVCRANICRSPMAEALLVHKLDLAGRAGQIRTDSAGTGAFPGQAVDPRVKKVLEAEGIPLKRKRARPLGPDDFEAHDFILAMDGKVLENLHTHCPAPLREKLHLVTRWSPELEGNDIPDPYYGNLSGFERVHGLLDGALDAFIEKALLPALHR